MKKNGNNGRKNGDGKVEGIGKADPPNAASPFIEIGDSGLRRYSGLIFEEFVRELKGYRAVKIYREMADNDPIVSAILFAMRTLISRISWRVHPGGQDQLDTKAADLVETCMGDMSTSWGDVISEICSYFTFGYAPLEIVYKRRQGDTTEASSKYTDGLIGWRKLAIRAQESFYKWGFDDQGGVQLFIQQSQYDFSFKTIPIEKLLIFRTVSAKNNPEGKSLLRSCYRPWYFKKKIEVYEGIGVERDLAGYPVMGVPASILSPNASDEEKATKAALREIVENVRRDEQEGMLLPLAYDDNGNKLYEFSLMSAAGNRQFNTTDIITRYDQRIAQSVLADVIMIGHQRAGSFALTESKIELFTSALTSFADGIADVFNRFGIPRLLKLNGIAVQNQPMIEHGNVEQVDLDKLGGYIKNLADAGAILFGGDTSDLLNRCLEVAGLPTSDLPQDGQQSQ